MFTKLVIVGLAFAAEAAKVCQVTVKFAKFKTGRDITSGEAGKTKKIAHYQVTTEIDGLKHPKRNTERYMEFHRFHEGLMDEWTGATQPPFFPDSRSLPAWPKIQHSDRKSDRKSVEHREQDLEEYLQDLVDNIYQYPPEKVDEIMKFLDVPRSLEQLLAQWQAATQTLDRDPSNAVLRVSESQVKQLELLVRPPAGFEPQVLAAAARFPFESIVN